MDQQTYANLLMVNVDRLVEHFVTSFASEKTHSGYRERLGRYVRWCEERGYHPLTVTVHQLNEYRDFVYSEPLADRTKDALYFAVSGFFRYLVRQGLRPDNPFAHRDAAPGPAMRPWLERPDALEWPVYERLMRWALEHPDYKPSLMVLLLGVNGLKTGEVRGAVLDDVRLSATPPHLMLPDRGPTASTPLNGVMAEMAAREVSTRGSGPLIITKFGEPTSNRSIQNAVRSLARKAGIEPRGVTPRRLRNSAGLAAARLGVDLPALKEMMGLKDRTAMRFYGVIEPGPGIAGATLVWRHLLLGDSANDLFSQVERLLDDPKITPTAPVVLTGAGLEQHLVRLCEANAIEIAERPSIDKLKGRLVGADLLSPAQGADIDRWARWRNDEAHGRANASLEDARTMLREVRDFVAATGGLLRGVAP